MKEARSRSHEGRWATSYRASDPIQCSRVQKYRQGKQTCGRNRGEAERSSKTKDNLGLRRSRNAEEERATSIARGRSSLRPNSPLAARARRDVNKARAALSMPAFGFLARHIRNRASRPNQYGPARTTILASDVDAGTSVFLTDLYFAEFSWNHASVHRGFAVVDCTSRSIRTMRVQFCVNTVLDDLGARAALG